GSTTSNPNVAFLRKLPIFAVTTVGDHFSEPNLENAVIVIGMQPRPHQAEYGDRDRTVSRDPRQRDRIAEWSHPSQCRVTHKMRPLTPTMMLPSNSPSARLIALRQVERVRPRLSARKYAIPQSWAGGCRVGLGLRRERCYARSTTAARISSNP